MIQMNTRELVKAVNGKLISGDDNTFTGVSIDSRKIESGQLFFAIIGERLDGHKYVLEALKRGAIGAIVDRYLDIPLQPGQFLVQVVETTKALQTLAHYYRQKFAIKVIGITGSVGKTTTKDMIAQVLQIKYRVRKTEGNLNNYYGLPLTLLQISPRDQVLVLEMGMSALKEIELLASLAAPEYGVITNVGHSHMEYLKTIENVAIAKQELVENLTGQRIAILNGDDPRVRKMAKLADQVIFYGIKENVDYLATEIESKDDLRGLSLILRAEGQKHAFQLPIPGEHNVYNALAAIAIGRIMGLSFAEIQEGFNQFRPGKMRMNLQKTNTGITILNDAYNANPASMKAALEVIAQSSSRKIAVLGDMLELGTYTNSSHRQLGKQAARSVDLLFVKGNYRQIVAEAAEEAGLRAEQIFTYETNEEIIEKLLSRVQPNDTILVKGSRGMIMEEIVKKLLEEV